MGRRQQQQIPGVSAWILDSQSDLGVSKHPEGQPRTSRQDLRVENPRWASAADRGCIAEFLRRLALRAQSGCSDRLPPLLRRSWYRVLSSDPTSHPADKLTVLQTAGEWHATYGYPGPAGPASDEVADNFVINDMMAKAATDKATPEEAVTWATKEVELIYKKWLS